VRYVTGFGRVWWDFVIGEDWRIAAGVGAVLAAGAALVAWTGVPDGVLTVGLGAALVPVVVASIVAPVWRARRASSR